jgi:hypothetical protein
MSDCMTYAIVRMIHSAGGGHVPQPEETCTDAESLRARVEELARDAATSYLAVRDDGPGQMMDPKRMRLLTGHEPIYRGSGYEPIR